MSLIVSIMLLVQLAHLFLLFVCDDDRVFLSSLPDSVLELLFLCYFGNLCFFRYLGWSGWREKPVMPVLFLSSLDEAFPCVSGDPRARSCPIVGRIPNVYGTTVKLLSTGY